MSKNLVFTICVGKRYGKIGEITIPTIEAYANKIGADFICNRDKSTGDISPHFSKFKINEYLNTYDRVIYLDADLIIRDDTPDLFEVVPEDSFGAFNEGAYAQGRVESMLKAAEVYGIEITSDIGKKYKGQYYNTGVMVISKEHQDIFTAPEEQHLLPFYEQSYLNAKIISNDIKVQELDYKFNRMTLMDNITGEDRHASYVIHYAGCPAVEKDFVEIIKKDVETWKQSRPDYKFKRHVLIDVVGGLGDQVSVEPVVRRMVEKELKDFDIHIATHFPRIYSHFKEYDNVNVYPVGTRIGGDMPLMRLNTIADEKHSFSQFAFHGMMHQSDYSAIYMMRKQIPHAEKQIKLKIGINDASELINSVGIHQFFNFIAVHPGKGWSSKTFPSDFWNRVIAGLSEKGHKVAIIGKYVSEKQGTIDDLVIPEGVFDWRNKLSLPSLITLLSQARVLISNDSAPIHIAGAFDNHIVLIPSCKHPDQILPYRNSYQYYKACALYKKLIVEEFFESDINEDSDKTTADIPDGARYEDYLPEPLEVINEAVKRFEEQ